MPKRRQKHQKPPSGFVFVEDYQSDEGTVILGIASRLGITTSTYKRWRMAGRGPATFRLGKRILARPEVIDAWITEQERAALTPKWEMRPPEPRLGRTRTARGREKR